MAQLHELTSSSESQFYSCSQGTLYLYPGQQARDKVAHTMKVRLVKVYNSCSQETTCNLLRCNKHVDALQIKAVSLQRNSKKQCQLSWAYRYCGWERKASSCPYVLYKVPFSPDRCGWKGCFMFSVQFMITKKWTGVHFITGVMSMSTHAGPQQRKWISCTCA